jgi:hypothetical protein
VGFTQPLFRARDRSQGQLVPEIQPFSGKSCFAETPGTLLRSGVNVYAGYYRQGIRFTISEAARRKVLDRLLALNHERHRVELAHGLHETSTQKTKLSGNKKRKKKDDSTITMAF